MPDVAVEVTNVDTNVSVHQATNGSGLYVVVGLKPGRYRVSVTKEGFRRIDLTDLVLNVQDVLSRNFQLQLGPVLASITVVADSANVNTTDASVSTVIDRKFVESLPLNGRTFNTLLQLTPGVVIAPSSDRALGQFSIAGQRTDANSFTVDGVSANFGVVASPGPAASGTGSAQAFSAIGGTSSLVSVDALQEFRIETSSYAPEFGRQPGGQVILTTRSGTNDFHGGVFEYFRNDVLDANDWFANQAGKPRSPERHNDFGGFLGGRILKDKTFFFISYEGARLRLPKTQPIQVPSEYARTYAATNTPALAPFLTAYPQPDDRTITPGVYTSQLTGVWSNSATLNAGSIRIDHTLNSRFSIFGRYNYAPSEITSRFYSLSTVSPLTVNTRTLTVGLNALLNNRTSNTFRANYSTESDTNRYSPDSFGGAVVPPPSLLFGSLSSHDNLAYFDTFDTTLYETGQLAHNITKQTNLVDDFYLAASTHQMKYGVDYRVIDLRSDPSQHLLGFSTTSVQDFLSSNGQVNLSTATSASARIRSQALSLYAQDTWRVFPRITLTYGVRWEFSPAPGALGTTTLASWSNVDNPSKLTLAPSGTPVWHTTHGNFAPRVGIAYALTDRGDLVLRAGGGIFYNLAVGSTLLGYFPNVVSGFTPGVQIPIADPTPYLPALSLQPPYPDGLTTGFSQNLKLPRSYQWNIALEKSFGGKQAISATYVGQAGRNLLRQEALFQPNSNFTGDFLVTVNDARSNYNAVQLQYRRPLSARLQAVMNYTWSHSLDNASDDAVVGLSNTVISALSDYASSGFDVRHSFSGALTYAIPSPTEVRPVAILAKDWSIDAVIVARSGFPFNALVFGTSPDPSGNAVTRPDLVAGQPLWVSNSMAPGGKILNVNAFSVPSTIRQGTEGRDDIRGFGLTEVDLSLGRKFHISERLQLQFRADAFNVLNHSNFTNPLGAFQFGTSYLQSEQMLNQGLGGLNPLFQQGGPRSLQLSLKLSF